MTTTPAITAEQAALLAKPAFATLACTRSDGTAQLTEVWYGADGDRLHIVTGASTAKALYVSARPRVTVAVADADNPYIYLELRGRGRVIEDDKRARAELRTIAARYLGGDADADDFVASLSDAPRVLIEVGVESVRHHVSGALAARFGAPAVTAS